MTTDLQAAIEAAWDGRDAVTPQTQGATRDAVEAALDLLDKGQARVAEKTGGDWVVHQWPPDSAPCRTASCAGPPISRRAWC